MIRSKVQETMLHQQHLWLQRITNYMTPSSVEAFAPHEYFCTMNDQRHQLEGGFNNNREWNVRAYISLLNHFYYLSLK